MAHLVRTVLALIVLSLVVGLILSALGIHPSELPAALGTGIGKAARILSRVLNWGWHYILLGASVVVPVWLLLYLLRRGRR